MKFKNGSIASVTDFIERIIQAGVRDDLHHNYFRGHSNIIYSMVPGVYRDSGYISNEDKIFKETIIRIPEEFSNQRSTIEKLVKMQHFGVPTRLLDIT
jgi:hypothetical protein